MNNRNYKVSGRKLTAKCYMSNSQERKAVKDGFLPSEKQAKDEIIHGLGRNAYNKLFREPARLAKKRLLKEYMDEVIENAYPNYRTNHG